MKRLIALALIIIIIVFSVQLHTTEAAQVYDDVFDAGLVYLYSDTNTEIQTLDSSSAGNPMETLTLSASIFGLTAFLPDGNMVVYKTNGSGTVNQILCYTAASSFTEECSWSGVNLNATTTVTDPLTGSTSVAGSSVLTGEFAINIAVASNEDIWIYTSEAGSEIKCFTSTLVVCTSPATIPTLA